MPLRFAQVQISRYNPAFSSVTSVTILLFHNQRITSPLSPVDLLAPAPAVGRSAFSSPNVPCRQQRPARRVVRAAAARGAHASAARGLWTAQQARRRNKTSVFVTKVRRRRRRRRPCGGTGTRWTGAAARRVHVTPAHAGREAFHSGAEAARPALPHAHCEMLLSSERRANQSLRPAGPSR